MDVLDLDQLEEVEAGVRERLTEIISRKNRERLLEPLLREMGLEDLWASVAGAPSALKTEKNGKVLLLGVPPAMRKSVPGIAKKLGLEAKRFEMVEYEDVTNYPFRNLQYVPTYAVILAGAVPHKACDIEGDSGILAHLENHRERYPQVVRLEAGGELKVTKTNLREALERLLRNGIIVAGSERFNVR